MPAPATKLLDAHVLAALTRDGRLLFATRAVRLFAYGAVSLVLVLYLTALGYSEAQAGLLLTLALLGDALVSLPITVVADRAGRRRMLRVGAGLMLAAGVAFAATGDFWLLLLAATVGVISPSGNEVGPFLAVEQAALSQLVPAADRTATFAWYNLVGSVATATGALAAGQVAALAVYAGLSTVQGYRVVLVGYALLGGVLWLMFAGLSADAEVRPVDPPTPGRSPAADAPRRRGGWLGLHRSRNVVAGLSALFATDAFAGGFVVQAILAAWLHGRFGADVGTIGAVFFGANLLSGVSALTASQIAKRFGLINTMVFTHVPSNVLLMLVPLMPDLPLAVVVLLLRFSISQMDVPTRQAFTMSVVDPDERSAAAGVTGVARTLGAAAAPALAGRLLSTPGLAGVPFLLAGGIKIAYDLVLWRAFRKFRPAG